MKYSVAFRNNVLKKVIPTESRSVIEVSKETGVSIQTIYGWLKQAKEGTLDEREDRMKAGDRTLSEKFTLVMETKGIPSECQVEWLRSQGLHTEHVQQWEQELAEMVAVQLIEEAVEAGAWRWKACEVLSLSVRPYERWKKDLTRIDARVLGEQSVKYRILRAKGNRFLLTTHTYPAAQASIKSYSRAR